MPGNQFYDIDFQAFKANIIWPSTSGLSRFKCVKWNTTFVNLVFIFRIPSIVLPKRITVLENDMNEYEIHQMVIIDRTVQTRSHLETEKGHTSRKAPTCRKYVKRREKIETIRCLERNIIVNADRQKINAAGLWTKILNTGPIMIGARLTTK